MSHPVAVVHRRLTKAEAGEPPERGQVWDEELQAWIPLGQKLALDRRRRDEQPEVMLTQYDERRQLVLRFVGEKMQEAEYDSTGALVEGKLHHCYVVPGSTRKALTKTGAEMLADLFKLRRGQSKVTASVETAEYVSARVHCELLDQDGQPAGAHEAAASTAEPSFRSPGARRKYGAKGDWQGPRGRRQWVESAPPDLRAALNDVVARAGKRAFVGAVIVATATDEIFEVAAEDEVRRREQDQDEQEQGAASSPAPVETGQPGVARPRQLTVGGRPLNAISTADLEKVRGELRSMPDPRWDAHREAVDAELEARRVDGTYAAELGEDDLPASQGSPQPASARRAVPSRRRPSEPASARPHGR